MSCRGPLHAAPGARRLLAVHLGIALAASGWLGGGCGQRGQGAAAPVRTPAAAAAPRQAGSGLPAAGPAAIRFVDVTPQSGVAWTHNTGAFGQRWLPETLGPGVIVFDANGDGLPDLLFVNGRSFPGQPGQATTPALYLNQGGFRFRDATHEAGLDFSAYCLGGAAGDIDNDGLPDLYLSCLGQDHLLHNEGGHFTDVSRQAGLSTEYGLGASVAFFDADRDGFLDIFVTRYVSWTPAKDEFCSAGNSKAKTYCTAAVYQGAAGHYYHNRGDGTFEERTREAGLYNPDAKMLGVVPLDVDGDGWPDLAVACDTSPNLLYHNRGNGTFEEIGVAAGVGVDLQGGTRGGMGVDAADYDHSGRPSLVVTYFVNEMVGLYRNQGNLFFRDVAPDSDVGRKTLATVGWGCFFFDYDLDGELDLLVANGHLDDREKSLSQPFAQPPRLFRNTGEGTLVDVTATAGGDLARPLVARGAAFADLDGDGDLDVVLTTNGGPAKLFENRGTGHGHWLRLHLEGAKSNRDGLGAEVRVTARGKAQSWYVHSGGSYLSQSQVDPTFGLGAARGADEVVIRWPSGTLQRLTGVAADRVLLVREPGPIANRAHPRAARPAGAPGGARQRPS